MKVFDLVIISNLSTFAPAVTAACRYHKITPVYRPFIYFLWFGACNEVLSFALIRFVGSNMISSNVYILLEFLLLLWQFKTWRNTTNLKLVIFVALGVITWIIDNFCINEINENNSIFRVAYSLMMVGLSFRQINKVSRHERESIFKNPVFFICLVFVFFFSTKAIVEVFNAFNLNVSTVFIWSVFWIFNFTNVLSNLLYVIPILWMPPKQKFSLPY